MVLESRTWTGRQAEDCAVQFLRSLGHRILARNWRWRRAEIDVISRFEDAVVFHEVKARSGCGTDLDSRHWMPSQAQQRRIVHAAHTYLRLCDSGPATCRFDVVLVRPDLTPVTVIRHVEGAFDACLPPSPRPGARTGNVRRTFAPP